MFFEYFLDFYYRKLVDVNFGFEFSHIWNPKLGFKKTKTKTYFKIFRIRQKIVLFQFLANLGILVHSLSPTDRLIQ